MKSKEILLEALNFYDIKIILDDGNHIKLQDNYEIEVEANGIYKLLNDGYIVGPFDDLNELCRFILS